MTDIDERLRFPMGTGDYDYRTVNLMREAADEIERLTVDNDRLRADYERLYQQLEQGILDGAIKIPHDTEFIRLYAEKERLRAEADHHLRAYQAMFNEVGRLRAALQALHDWYVEYACINNLFNADGTPATFHELLEARRVLEPKP